MTINSTPHQTFEQLPTEKRQRFVNAALQEFGQKPYRTASVSTIVAELGIAKGSFYQYFENKAGLYIWLIGQMGTAKVSHLGEVDDQGFFEFIRGSYIVGLNFWNEQPAWAALAGQLMQSTGDQEIDDYLEGMRHSAINWWSGLIVTAQAEGEVRDDLDPTVTATLINAMMSTGMRDLYRSTMGTSGHSSLDSDTVLSLAETAIRLVSHGLEPSRIETA